MGIASKLAVKAAKNIAEDVTPIFAVKVANDSVKKRAPRYLVGRQNSAFPGVWDSPRVIAQEAAERARLTPEDPALREVFGVTRDDLYQIGKQGTRQGNVSGDSVLNLKAKARGSDNAKGAMTKPNAQRLQDALFEGGKYPELYTGMDAWYVGDPLYKKLEVEYGPAMAASLFNDYRTFSGLASPGTEVPSEIIRGGAAGALARQGRFDDFVRYGKERGLPGTPDDMLEANIPGHVYHRTSQVVPMQNYLDSGLVDMKSAKVPLYVSSFGADAPGVNFQTNRPVADAHFTRATGVANIRNSQDPGASMRLPEAATFGPWFEQNVAKPSGLEAVPAQARLWGIFSQRTGISPESGIGAPKLEMIARHIKNLATREGISTDKALFRHVGPKKNLFSVGGRVSSR